MSPEIDSPFMLSFVEDSALFFFTFLWDISYIMSSLFQRATGKLNCLFSHDRYVEKLNNTVNSTCRSLHAQHNDSLWHYLTLEGGFNGHLHFDFIWSWSYYCQISQMKSVEESISYLFVFHLLLSAIVKHPQYTTAACLLIPLMSLTTSCIELVRD